MSKTISTILCRNFLVHFYFIHEKKRAYSALALSSVCLFSKLKKNLEEITCRILTQHKKKKFSALRLWVESLETLKKCVINSRYCSTVFRQFSFKLGLKIDIFHIKSAKNCHRPILTQNIYFLVKFLSNLVPKSAFSM